MKKIIYFALALFAFSACEKENEVIYADFVEITDFPENILIGETGYVECEILPQNASLNTLSFTSSDPSVIDVSSNGVLMAKKIGSADISVSTKDGKVEDKITVKVSDITDFVAFSRLSATFKYDGVLFDLSFTNFSNHELTLKEFRAQEQSTGKDLDVQVLSGSLKKDDEKDITCNLSDTSFPVVFTVTFSFKGEDFRYSYSYDRF